MHTSVFKLVHGPLALAVLCSLVAVTFAAAADHLVVCIPYFPYVHPEKLLDETDNNHHPEDDRPRYLRAIMESYASFDVCVTLVLVIPKPEDKGEAAMLKSSLARLPKQKGSLVVVPQIHDISALFKVPPGQRDMGRLAGTSSGRRERRGGSATLRTRRMTFSSVPRPLPCGDAMQTCCGTRCPCSWLLLCSCLGFCLRAPRLRPCHGTSYPHAYPSVMPMTTPCHAFAIPMPLPLPFALPLHNGVPQRLVWRAV